MHIGILQCGHTPDHVAATHGDYDALFHALFAGQGLTFATWDVVDMEFPESISAADGWLVTGSKHGAYEDLPFIAPLEAFIHKAHAARVPMIGICFGHQIIAQALGGTVEKFSGGWAVGRHDYSYDGLGDVALNAWHQDQVIRVPEAARVVARSAFCENAALVYGDHILTLQPHPEISDAVLTSYLEARGTDPAYPPEIMERASKLRGLPSDEALFAKTLADFLKAAQAGAAS